MYLGEGEYFTTLPVGVPLSPSIQRWIRGQYLYLKHRVQNAAGKGNTETQNSQSQRALRLHRRARVVERRGGPTGMNTLLLYFYGYT